MLRTLFQTFGALCVSVVQNTADTIHRIYVGLAAGGMESVNQLIPLSILILECIILIFVFDIIRMIAHLSREFHLPWRKRYQKFSVNRGGEKRILILGDSTAYGTGASRPEETIAGRLAADFPHTDIINMAVNGSLTYDALKQLYQAGNDAFDLIIICTGGNDIWHFTDSEEVRSNLMLLMQMASVKSNNNVVVLFYANLGNSDVFPRFFRPFLSKRSEEIRRVFRQVTNLFNVPLIELFYDAVDGYDANPFVENPDQYYAKDHMHPNSLGYELWYRRMWEEMRRHNVSFHEYSPTDAVQQDAAPVINSIPVPPENA